MNSNAIFKEIFDQFHSDDIFDDWRKISENCRNSEEKEKIWKIITRVSCHNLDMYEAGKEIEAQNPVQIDAFRNFLIKFATAFQSLPYDHQTPLNSKIFLKIIDFSAAGNSKNSNFPEDFLEISRLLELAGNILIKDLLENAVKLYPDDGKLRDIGPRDILDGVILSDDVETEKYQEEAFLKMKNKLINIIPTTSTSSFERKLFSCEMKELKSSNEKTD